MRGHGDTERPRNGHDLGTLAGDAMEMDKTQRHSLRWEKPDEIVELWLRFVDG